MNCEQLRARLDAYMDGELSDAELREMEAHAAACEDCKRELASARLLRDVLHGMPEEVAVPLDAQASWRRAVREEAGKRPMRPEAAEESASKSGDDARRRPNRRWLRAVYAAAAALVLVFGAAAMLRSAPEDENAGPMTVPAPRIAAAMPTEAVVARDGEVRDAAWLQDERYAARKTYGAEDFDAACATVEELAEEYSGEFAREGSEEPDRPGARWALYRVELPGEYMEDFLTALSHVGQEQNSESADVDGDTAVIYVEIDELSDEQ